MDEIDRREQEDDTDIAIVGMAAHLPGAADVAEYWSNLVAGRSSIVRLDEEALLAAGESPERLYHRNYVPAAAPLDGFETFDGEFFGFSPKEAAIMDPQHRQFLEVCWEALENAGHAPERFAGPIGVFAGCGMGSYFYFNLCSNRHLVDDVGMFLLRHTGNDKDFLATRVSHVLDLRGPSVSVQTACSTSLVAVHYAAQSLLNGECDMALAGGVTIELPHRRGYLFEEGEILSPDGECHAFDHRAQGTVFGSGAGAVALRRLSDAIADGDHIWGVLKGTAINNDGAAKAGYLAPSVEGQSAAIREAQAVAGVEADTIGYVECHGTGTYLGDPIEVAALTQAFRATTDGTGFCRIGSVKTNIGHLDTAAGAASLIKATMSVREGVIPPSLGFERPNPDIDFEASPFRVNDRLTDWTANGPRRAGVNSLGVGGTNAHAIVEEPPAAAASEPGDWPFALLTLSARSAAALDAGAARLAAHLRANPGQPLDDVAWTLREGRRDFDKRRVLVAATHEEAAAKLESGNRHEVFSHTLVADAPEVVFMFPGGGAQYAGMARDLYETEPVFQDWMDRGLAILEPRIDHDIRAVWLPEPGGEDAADAALKAPSVQLPLIMIVEHALARLWMSWGVEPDLLVGHSMGENVAACLADVISFEDCIELVLLRGRLFETVGAGGMLSVPLSAEDAAPYMGDDLDVACVNAPDLTVLSGPAAALGRAEAAMAADEIEAQRIAIDVAAHSRMLEPILGRFREFLAGLDLKPPRIPVLSNRTGRPLTPEEATDPDYWTGHLRGTVRFGDCIAALSENPARVFLEVGPGKALGSLAQANGGVSANQIVNSLRHPDHEVADDAHFLATLGRLWATGIEIDWGQIWGEARRRRVPLPTYAFQRAPYFIEPGAGIAAEPAAPRLERTEDLSDWGWAPRWRKSVAACEIDPETDLPREATETWLVFLDALGLGARVAGRLRGAGERVVTVREGDAFARLEGDAYALSTDHGRAGYEELIAALVAEGASPSRIVHMWSVTGGAEAGGQGAFNLAQDRGFYSLLHLAQAIEGEALPRPIQLTAFTDGAAAAGGAAPASPAKSTLVGPARVLPKEVDGLTVRLVDLPLAAPAGPDDALVAQVMEECLAEPGNEIAAIRGPQRLTQGFRRVPLPAFDEADLPLRQGGTYVITGGFGGIGLTVAETLWRRCGANLVLVGRSALPERGEWDAHLRRAGPADPVSRRIAAVRRLEEMGARVLVAAADVASQPEVLTLMRDAERAFGAIHGLVHAAGTIDDAPFMTKTPASVEAVFAPKVRGAQVLAETLDGSAMDWIVLFSSTSTATGPVGQIDYVAANEYLNAYAQSRAGQTPRIVALNWGVWNEVGMAVDALSERTGERPAAPVEPLDLPLWSERTFDDSGRVVLRATLDARRWLLDEHRTIAGDALVPGTGYMEMAAQALAAQGEPAAFAMRDLIFLRPLGVEEGAPVEVRLRLTATIDGYAMEVQGACRAEGRDGFVTHARANLSLLPLRPPPAADLRAMRARCPRLRIAPEGGHIASPQEAHLSFGPRWHVLRRTALGEGEGIADLSLDPALRGDLAQGWRLHPGLMDLATGWAMELIEGYAPDDLWVPVSYGTVRVHGALPAEIVSLVRGHAGNSIENDFASFDVLITDPSGAVLAEVRDFSIRRMSGASLMRPRAPSAGELEPAAGAAPRALSSEEERMRETLDMGIRPEEGAEAFLRVLAAGMPQAIVTSVPLDALIASAAASSAAREETGDKFDRPQLDSEYAAPETDVQRTLVGFWEDLLGVNGVGISDDFFDLGGHSLIAVRLFAQVKKAYKVDLPISVLFEAPTVAACAALIEEQIGESRGPAEAGGEPSPAAPARRNRHLVPMHDGEGGRRTPLFMVAGMFGNVLNLRYLASLMQSDRPVYGLQARGLYRGDRPHEDFAEAARDHIAEMRQVRPGGPYHIGGYSGGGLVAYEIARQLADAGEEIASVIFLDTPLPVRPGITRRDKLAIKMQELRENGAGHIARWAAGRVAGRGGVAPPGPSIAHNAEIEAAFHVARFRYEVEPRGFPVTLFRPPLSGKWRGADGTLISEERAYVVEDNFWRPILPQIEVIETPGDHDSMVLEPNVRTLALRLREVLERAEAEARGDAGWPQLRAAE